MTYDPNGRFTDIKRIQSGGMAEIFDAYDNALKKNVALKVMHPDLAVHDQTIYRFSREVDISRVLSYYPGFRDFYGAYELRDSCYAKGVVPAMAFELLDGVDLQNLLGSHKILDDLEAWFVILRVAERLEVMHNLGIIHRDVKPENIIFETNGPLLERRVSLIDYGIARYSEEKKVCLANGFEEITRSGRKKSCEPNIDWWKRRLTAVDAYLGTPEYAAPEVKDGISGRRSDLFSLGCVLYKMITRRFPFVSGSKHCLYNKQSMPDPKNPDDARKERGILPSALTPICIKLLQKDPKQRYQSAKWLISALCSLEENLFKN